MRRALLLAERGWGRVHPNPLVGAVVVKDDVVVGGGWHEEFGLAHAEVNALCDAGSDARNATLYVTLEPCSHHGKTPPCTDAIITAGIRRVVYAAGDPNPRAAGGHKVLREAGIEVHGGILAAESERLNAPFHHAFDHDTPWLALKLACSLDGRIAAAVGQETRITGPEATAEVHRLRAGFDAIMVGIGTVISDDPLLTTRGTVTPRRPPTRVVLDTALRIPTESELVLTIDKAPLIVVTGPDASPERAEILRSRGATIMTAQTLASGALDPQSALKALHDHGIRSILCEGGAAVASSLLEQRLVRRLTLFFAPTILGPDGVPAFAGRAVDLDPAHWEGPRLTHHGRDIAVTFDARSGSRSLSRTLQDD